MSLQLLADVGQPSAKQRSREPLLLQLLPQRVVAVVGQEALLAAGEEGVDRPEPEPVSVDPVAAERWPHIARHDGFAVPRQRDVLEPHGAVEPGCERGPDRLDVLAERHQADEHQPVLVQRHLVEAGLDVDRLAVGPLEQALQTGFGLSLSHRFRPPVQRGCRTPPPRPPRRGVRRLSAHGLGHESQPLLEPGSRSGRVVHWPPRRVRTFIS